MIQYLRPSFWRVALKDPLTWLALAIDAMPIVLVIFFGWRAEALVLLYWAENVVIGGVTVGRLVASGAMSGVPGLIMSAFLVPFFIVHYGLFCFGHGVFVFAFSKSVSESVVFNNGPGPGTLIHMVEQILAAFPGMMLVLGLIALFQIAAAVKDYWPRAGVTYPNPQEEMFAPYGRIVTLHIAIILGAGLLLAIGDPMLGVLLLILIRMGVSVIGRAWRDREKSGTLPSDEPLPNR